jgi:hypothetical protein
MKFSVGEAIKLTLSIGLKITGKQQDNQNESHLSTMLLQFATPREC